MTDQEIYDRTLDEPAVPEPGGPSQPATALPDEAYYRRAPEPRRARRASGLGAALVLVGLLLLAFQLFGRGEGFGNPGSLTLADKTLPGNRIELSAAASDVEVRPWDGSGIHVEATQHGGSRGDYTVDIVPAGDTVRVTESNRSFFCLFCSRSVSYRISVPRGAQADIHTASGEIDVAGLSGAVSLASVSGDIHANDLSTGLTVSTTSGEVRLDNIAGKLDVGSISGDVQLEDGKVEDATVNTTSGRVDLNGISGPLNLTSVSGDITVRDARDGQLHLSTTSGGIEYAGGLARGSTNELNSISGDVTLRLPRDSSFRLDASTVSGDLSSDFDLRDRQSGRGALAGVAGDGSATLTISTTSGEIAVEQE
jgi:DUF4097 and DUF4098 domain-containing protein YvlB